LRISYKKEGLMVYLLLKVLVGPFIKQVKGISNIPKGPCLLVMNHASYIDAALIDFVIREKLGRKTYFLQSKEWLMKHWWYYPFFVWILRHIPTNGSVAKSLDKLEKGNIIGLFPEASRSRTGKLQKIRHSGLAVLAVESGVPVVPVGLENTFEWWPPQKFLPNFRKIMKVNIGKPMKFKQKLTKTSIEDINRKIMKKVGILAKKEYKW